MAHRTRSRITLTSHYYAIRKYPSDFITNWDFSVIDATTGQTLEHQQLRKHPDYKDVWDLSYSNELGRLYQGVRSNPTKTGQCIEGTDNFRFILYENIP